LNRREIKQQIYFLLQSHNLDKILNELKQLPDHRVVSLLISFLSCEDQKIKWTAVSVLGEIIARLAKKDIEAVRDIIHRLMWHLNSESGSFGLGVPEALGEILARNDALRKQYLHILISYLRKTENFIEHPLLQQGIIWALGRLGESGENLPPEIILDLKTFLSSPNPTIRGLTIWALGFLPDQSLKNNLNPYLSDSTVITIYLNSQLINLSLSELTKMTLARIR
jgi:vesicle coat complex subunit